VRRAGGAKAGANAGAKRQHISCQKYSARRCASLPVVASLLSVPHANPFCDSVPAQRRINYVGFKGTQTNTRHGVVECVYEARAVPGDHQKVKGEGSGGVV